jgi:hypothetical protein
MASVVEFIPIPQLVRARITAVAKDYNATMMNLFNFDVGHAVSPADVAAVAALLDSWVNNHYTGQVCSQVHFTTIDAWDGSDQFGAAASSLVDADGTGVSVLASLDFAWAPLVTLKTNHRGRAGTGGWYAFTPVTEAVNPNNYEASHMAGLVSIAGQLKDAATTAGITWVVASESRLALYPIMSFKPTSRLTMQTRRRPDFGR